MFRALRALVTFVALQMIVQIARTAPTDCWLGFTETKGVQAEIGSETLAKLKQTGWRSLLNKVGPAFAWPVDGPIEKRSAGTYESQLVDILQKLGVHTETYFQDHLNARIGQRKSTHVLDVFGSGFFAGDPAKIDSVTGIRIEPYPYEIESHWRNRKRPLEVLGNAFALETWQQLDQLMLHKRIPGFDVVTMIPFGAWFGFNFANQEQRRLGLQYLIENVAARLNPKGHFYFQITTVLAKEDLDLIRKEIESRFPRKLVWGDEAPFSNVNGALLPR